MRWTVTDSKGLSNLFVHLGNMPTPFTVEIGKKRTLSQNSLFHAWMGEIAKHRGDVTAERVKAELHIAHGIPLLRAEDPDYSDFILSALGGRSHGECCNIIEKGFIPCTSLMNADQLKRYMDIVWREWSPHVRLMDPEMLKYEKENGQ